MPSQATIGIAAPVILILARLVQGFATGGEYGTSATCMSEAATRERRGFFSSFQYVTLVGGHVLAQFTLLVLDAVLTDEQLREFGWRIGFAIGGVAAVVVFWLRRSMDESLSEEQLAAIRSGEDTGAGSIRELVDPLLEAAAAVLPDHPRWHGGVLHLQRQRPGDGQGHLQGPRR